MHQIKNILFLFTLLMLFSCIKPYNPVIDSNSANKYVVSGRVTDIEGWQDVDVSLSSPIGSPKYIPLSDCKVYIKDDKDNIFELTENNPGQYHVWMAKENLTPGTSYKVMVITPGREILESGFDKMPTSLKLDSVYYILKDNPAPDPGQSPKVMQFCVDLNAEGSYSQYYKYEVVETWEYHAAHAAEYYYDGTFHKIDPPDTSHKTCWITVPALNVFTISTKSLSHNTYKQFPLHVIDGHTSRLGVLYSMLVRQFALNENAYNYWEQMRINSNEQGGLYEKQPLAIKGNLLNVSNAEKKVLGYFYAASESARRYFYKDVEGIELGFSNNCVEEPLGRMGWLEFSKDDYPVYYYYPTTHSLLILTQECVDCRITGGTTVKPEFWPR
jgi:hypothetical protein